MQHGIQMTMCYWFTSDLWVLPAPPVPCSMQSGQNWLELAASLSSKLQSS